MILNVLPIWIVKLFYSHAQTATMLPSDDIAWVRTVAKILNTKVEYLK